MRICALGLTLSLCGLRYDYHVIFVCVCVCDYLLLHSSVLFDTGSSGVWIHTSDATIATESHPHAFNATASITLQRMSQRVDARFGRGQLVGDQASDWLAVGPLRVKYMFARCDASWLQEFAMHRFAGIVGLGLDSPHPFVDRLFQAYHLPASMFSIYLSSLPDQTSVISFGQPDPSYFQGTIASWSVHNVKCI